MTGGFNERLADLLQKKHLTQKELAEKAGVTQAAMSHYMKGDRYPRASVMARIADALDVTVEFLINGADKDTEEELAHATRLIARNVQQMTKEQKIEIIRILMEDE